MKNVIVSQSERAKLAVEVFSINKCVFHIECEKYEYLPSDENPLRIVFYGDGARSIESFIAVFEVANIIGFKVKQND